MHLPRSNLRTLHFVLTNGFSDKLKFHQQQSNMQKYQSQFQLCCIEFLHLFEIYEQTTQLRWVDVCGLVQTDRILNKEMKSRRTLNLEFIQFGLMPNLVKQKWCELEKTTKIPALMSKPLFWGTFSNSEAIKYETKRRFVLEFDDLVQTNLQHPLLFLYLQLKNKKQTDQNTTENYQKKRFFCN